VHIDGLGSYFWASDVQKPELFLKQKNGDFFCFKKRRDPKIKFCGSNIARNKANLESKTVGAVIV